MSRLELVGKVRERLLEVVSPNIHVVALREGQLGHEVAAMLS
jgi:hypothetical protein